MGTEGEPISKLVARATEWIQRRFRRSDQRQVGLDSERLWRESADIAHRLYPALHHRNTVERHRALQVVRSAKSVSPSLERAISPLARKLTFGGAAQFRVLVTGKPRSLTPSLREQIYLIVREAAINASHHSA